VKKTQVEARSGVYASVAEEVVHLRKCPRLVKYREKVAREKRRTYREWEYWGTRCAGFGGSQRQLFILGLPTAAHGANRTGRRYLRATALGDF